MNIIGKITYKGNVEEYGTNGFTKKSITVEEVSQYPNSLNIDFIKDKISLLDNFTVGQMVKVDYNTKANESNNKRYNSVTGWRITAE